MKTARLFPNGRSQAVRLPKEFQFAGEEVYVNKVGGVVMLVSCEEGWNVLAESLEHFTEDFMAERDQSSLQERHPVDA